MRSYRRHILIPRKNRRTAREDWDKARPKPSRENTKPCSSVSSIRIMGQNHLGSMLGSPDTTAFST